MRDPIFLLCVSGLIVSVSSLFTGHYSDPNHPNCPRIISDETSSTCSIEGSDNPNGDGFSCDGSTDSKWGPLSAIIDGHKIVADFSSKGGPSSLSGIFVDEGAKIEWEDGNSWTSVRILPTGSVPSKEPTSKTHNPTLSHHKTENPTPLFFGKTRVPTSAPSEEKTRGPTPANKWLSSAPSKVHGHETENPTPKNKNVDADNSFTIGDQSTVIAQKKSDAVTSSVSDADNSGTKDNSVVPVKPDETSGTHFDHSEVAVEHSVDTSDKTTGVDSSVTDTTVSELSDFTLHPSPSPKTRNPTLDHAVTLNPTAPPHDLKTPSPTVAPTEEKVHHTLNPTKTRNPTPANRLSTTLPTTAPSEEKKHPTAANTDKTIDTDNSVTTADHSNIVKADEIVDGGKPSVNAVDSTITTVQSDKTTDVDSSVSHSGTVVTSDVTLHPSPEETHTMNPTKTRNPTPPNRWMSSAPTEKKKKTEGPTPGNKWSSSAPSEEKRHGSETLNPTPDDKNLDKTIDKDSSDTTHLFPSPLPKTLNPTLYAPFLHEKTSNPTVPHYLKTTSPSASPTEEEHTKKTLNPTRVDHLWTPAPSAEKHGTGTRSPTPANKNPDKVDHSTVKSDKTSDTDVDSAVTVAVTDTDSSETTVTDTDSTVTINDNSESAVTTDSTETTDNAEEVTDATDSTETTDNSEDVDEEDTGNSILSVLSNFFNWRRRGLRAVGN